MGSGFAFVLGVGPPDRQTYKDDDGDGDAGVGVKVWVQDRTPSWCEVAGVIFCRGKEFYTMRWKISPKRG